MGGAPAIPIYLHESLAKKMDGRVKPGHEEWAVAARRANQRFGCPVPFAKIFRFTRRANHLYKFAPSHPTRGAYHDRHETRGADAVDAAAFCARGDRRAGYPVSGQQRADERRCCVRRTRVVLTPRRWCQVGGVASAQPGLDKTYPLTTVAKEPGHRGELEISRKTIACGNVG
jgi:hypothetical protein